MKFSCLLLPVGSRRLARPARSLARYPPRWRSPGLQSPANRPTPARQSVSDSQPRRGRVSTRPRTQPDAPVRRAGQLRRGQPPDGHGTAHDSPRYGNKFRHCGGESFVGKPGRDDGFARGHPEQPGLRQGDFHGGVRPRRAVEPPERCRRLALGWCRRAFLRFAACRAGVPVSASNPCRRSRWAFRSGVVSITASVNGLFFMGRLRPPRPKLHPRDPQRVRPRAGQRRVAARRERVPARSENRHHDQQIRFLFTHPPRPIA